MKIKIEARARLEAAGHAPKPKAPKLPAGIVAIQEWQSSSTQLDAELQDNCEKAGCYLGFFELEGMRRGYEALIIATRKITNKDKKFLEDNLYELGLGG